jgi:dihydroorotase
LEEVIEKSTASPARVINRPDLGNLSVGSEADVAVFSVKKGEFGFTDVRRNTLKGTQKMDAELTLRAGKIVWDLNGVSGPIWDSPQALTR